MPSDNHSLNGMRSAAAMPCRHGRSSRPFIWIRATKFKMAKSHAAARTTGLHSQQQHTVSLVRIAFAMALMATYQSVTSAAPAASTADLLPDPRAVVGQIFVYNISNAVIPLAEGLQVAEADSDCLPKWLYYNDRERTLTGIPMDDDAGAYVISVRSRGNGDESLGTLFAITVVAEDLVTGDASSASRSLDQVQLSRTVCSREGQLMLATVIIDADAAALTARDRVRIVRTVADTLGLKRGPDDGDSSDGGAAYRLLQLGELRLATAKGDELTFRKGRHSPASLIVVGAGNVLSGRWLSGVAVSWPVGCRSIADSSLKAVERLVSTAKDGTLAQELSFDIIGWSITSFQAANDDTGRNFGSHRRRHRRQAIKATATSLPDRAPPTSAGTVTSSVAAGSAALSSGISFWKGEDGKEYPCSRATTVYHKEICSCKMGRDAVFACPDRMHLDNCQNLTAATKECQLRGSANSSSPGVMSRDGENGATPSVISTSMQPDENATSLSSDVIITHVTRASVAPTVSSAPSTTKIVAIATLVVLSLFAWCCAGYVGS